MLAPWSKSTMSRRRRVEQLWGEFQKLSRGRLEPGIWITSLLQGFESSTVYTYAMTLQGLHPQPHTKPSMAGRHPRSCGSCGVTTTPQQATIGTIEKLRDILTRARSSAAHLALLLMFLSASRFGDLHAMKAVGTWRPQQRDSPMLAAVKLQVGHLRREASAEILVHPVAGRTEDCGSPTTTPSIVLHNLEGSVQNGPVVSQHAQNGLHATVGTISGGEDRTPHSPHHPQRSGNPCGATSTRAPTQRRHGVSA